MTNSNRDKRPWYRFLSFKGLSSRTKEKLKKEIQKDLQKAIRAAELKTIHKTQSEIDKNVSKAASMLLKSLEGIDDAIIQVGSILVIKTQGKPIVRSLTQKELQHIEDNPKLLRMPDIILEELSSIRKLPSPEPQRV